jgi:hypothetical protein
VTIYLIQNLLTTNVKIGYTKGDGKDRLNGLQTANCGELKLIATFKGDYKLEAKLHLVCDAFRIRNEWFTAECIEVCQNYVASLGLKDMSVFRERHPGLLENWVFTRDIQALNKRIKDLEVLLNDSHGYTIAFDKQAQQEAKKADELQVEVIRLKDEVSRLRKALLFALDTEKPLTDEAIDLMAKKAVVL